MSALDYYRSIPGWTCPRLLEYYDELAVSMTSGIHVEVGVAYGKSLAYLAARIDPAVQLLAVDSWRVKMGRNTAEVWSKVSHYASAWTAAYQYLHLHAPLGIFGRAELCQGNSPDVAKALDFEVDSVFLDGSHEYEAVRADIQAWERRLKPGGRLAGHDANAHYPGVERAVRELLPGAEFRAPVEEGNWGGVWTWRK